jgi:hypothetical protein
MKIFYTIDENLKPVNFIKTKDNQILLKLSNIQSTKDCLGLHENGIEEYIQNKNNLSFDNNVISITTGLNDIFNQPIYNNNKESQFIDPICKIYIPFKTDSYANYLFRIKLNSDDVQKLLQVFPDAKEIKNSIEDTNNWKSNNLPKLKIINTNKSGEFTKIKVQLILAGNDISKVGVRIFAKSSSGYISSREVYTDENGIAEFKATRYGLEQNEIMKVEFGFKYFSNIVSENI